MLRSPVESYSLQIKNKVPNLVANLQGMLVGLGISGSGSIKRKETWRQQFESAPGYFCSLSPYFQIHVWHTILDYIFDFSNF
jgi:hypothetical protein